MNYETLTEVIAGQESAQKADKDLRSISREAQHFCDDRNGQWEQDVYDKFEGKPRYTIDKVGHIVDLQCSAIESKSYGVKFYASGENMDDDAADVRAGMFRDIQARSGAQSIYNRSGRKTVKTGFDCWRVKTQWRKGEFKQEFAMEYVSNSIDRVWFDEGSVDQFRQDSNHFWVMTEMPKSDFKAKWPKKDVSGLGSDRDLDVYWYKPEKIMVGEFYYCKKKEVTLALLVNGNVVRSDQPTFDYTPKDQIVRERKEMVSVWYSRKYSASEWLDDAPVETVFESPCYIPLYGNFDVAEGKVLWRGAVERLMDSQRILNYATSRKVAEGALQPMPFFWMTHKQAGDTTNQSKLSKMNQSTSPIQFYTPDEKAPGVPMRDGNNPINPHLTELVGEMSSNIESVAGKYGVALGKNQELQSGVALDLQQNQSTLGDLKWEILLKDAICRTAQVMNEAWAKVYDTQQSITVVGEDGKQATREINKPQDGMIQNDMTGDFSVAVEVSEGYDSRQREATKAILEIAAVKPDVLQTGADLLFKNIQAPGMDQLGDRYRQAMLQSGQIPPDQMTDKEQEMMQAQASQPKPPADPLVMLEMQRLQTEQMREANREKQLSIEVAKLQQSGYKLSIDEQKTAADIGNTNADTLNKLAQAEKTAGETTGQQIDNLQKVTPQVQTVTITQQ